MKSTDAGMPEWIGGLGPEADIIISTRARLARSLAAFPFPARASREDLSMVARETRGACSGLAERLPGLRSVSIEGLGPEERSYLMDAHVASAEHLSGGDGKFVILDRSAVLSVMVNEEDHIRLQAVMSGLRPRDCWELVDWADDVLAQKLDFGFSERYGYLTADVSNVGTGLRVSVMMHLAGLGMAGTLRKQLRAAYDLGVSVRGMFGEGSRFVGDLFQVSNEVTLGPSETDLVERVRTVAQHLLAEERAARRELLDGERTRLIDSASRALKALQSAMSMRADEAIRLMSALRLASATGLAANCEASLLNRLLAGMQAWQADSPRAGIDRAKMLRHSLAETHIIPS